MTEQEKQQLSLDVAEKYGIPAVAYYPNMGVIKKGIKQSIDTRFDEYWLNDDSERCFDLAVDNEMNLAMDEDAVSVNKFGKVKLLSFEYYKNYATKQEATRIAILKALLAKE